MAATNGWHLKIKLRVQNNFLIWLRNHIPYAYWTKNNVESQLFFHPDITITADWVLESNYLVLESNYLPIPIGFQFFHPNITIMVDWVLKTIIYLSPLVSTVFFTLI